MTEMTEYPHGVFCWVDLVAHDLDAAKRWYCELFGWTTAEDDTPDAPRYVLFFKDGKVVAGVGQMSDQMKSDGVPPMWNNYVSVTDCAAIEAKARALGAEIAVPTMKIMDAGWMCFLQDPTGAHFALWQADQHHGAALVNEPGSLSWNELATRDVDGAKRFYTELFGWSYEAEQMAGFVYHTIKAAGGRENGGIMEMSGAEWDGVPPHWNTYFSVADLDASVAKLRETGGTVHVEPHPIPNVGRFSVVADPQGAVFTFIQLERVS